MSNGTDNLFDESNVVYRYTRKQAIEDGVLVDLTEWAQETGFVIPVACTAAVWNGHVVPPGSTTKLGQSERGRAHDVLWMLFNAIRRSPHAQDSVLFKVIFLNARSHYETVRLKALCGPGDDGEAVITILLPDED